MYFIMKRELSESYGSYSCFFTDRQFSHVAFISRLAAHPLLDVLALDSSSVALCTASSFVISRNCVNVVVFHEMFKYFYLVDVKKLLVWPRDCLVDRSNLLFTVFKR